MRIAAYVAGYEPEAGGGYTFESDVLEALIDVAAKQPSPGVCLICPARQAAVLSGRLRGTGIDVFAVKQGTLQRRLNTVLSESGFLRAHWRRRSALDRAVGAAGADVVWFLGAGVHVTDHPFVTVVWDLQHRATPWFPEMSAGGLWDRRERAHDWFLKRAAMVVAGTEAGRAELERYYQLPSERVVLLPHPTPRFSLEAGPAAPRAGELEHLVIRRPFYLYPAQFWPHKNHVNLVRGFAQLVHRHGVDSELVLVGSDKGNRSHVAAEASAAGVADRIRYLGFVPRQDLIALYRNAVALAYVSWCGPENLPPLEAFAVGCPVVAARVPGAAEQLDDAAILIDPADPADIAAGLARIRNEGKLRAELVTRGLARARRWTALDYVHGVLDALGRFEPIVRCWRAAPT
jgi:glycosyltransferase involved in cell wall biosynthesis